jgi:hypothetical protein
MAQAFRAENSVRKSPKTASLLLALPLAAGALSLGCAHAPPSSQIDLSQPGMNDKIKSGRAAWSSDYYPWLVLARAGAAADHKDAIAYFLADSLDEKAAAAFYDYLRVARLNGLEDSIGRAGADGNGTMAQGQGTRKIVVETVARLYASDPSKIPGYFDSIRDIASKSGNDVAAFSKELAGFSRDAVKTYQR